jgi:hypothetical protein
MTPEQVRGTPVGPATDVFALGQLCVFAATGRPAFGEGPTEAIFYRIAYEHPMLDDCPSELRDIVSRCLAKAPGARPLVEEIIRLARAGTAGDTMQLAGAWLPPAVAATLVAYDAGAARAVVRGPDTEVRPGPPGSFNPPALRVPVQEHPTVARPSDGVSMSAVVALTAVVAVAVLLAAVVGAHMLSSSGTPAPAAATSSRSPMGAVASTPIASSPPPLASHPQPSLSLPERTQPVAPAGFTAYSESGYALEVPSDWHRRTKSGDSSGSVYWDAPDGVSYVQVDPQAWSPGDAHTQAVLADTAASGRSSHFPGYHLIGISDVAFQQGATDWEFGFSDPSGAGPVHGRDRFFQAGGRPFAIYLRAAEANWLGMQDALAHFYSSFRLQP